MRLLITTQAIDLDDPVLAFFHGWILEIARNFESVEIICLKVGRHALPEHVRIHSLGKEQGRSRWKYVMRFYYYLWVLRKKYDAVFVHMNPEYAVLGGFLWRIFGKKVGLWYIHPKKTFLLHVAVLFANRVMSASARSFPIRTSKLVALGHGVDTVFFSPAQYTIVSEKLRAMGVARIAPVKRLECIIGAVGALVREQVPIQFDFYGTELDRDRAYAETIRKLVPAATPPEIWTWKGNASPEEVRDAFRAHDVHVNATDSGSFDKVVIESMACGCLTIASNAALQGILPAELLFKEGDSVSLAKALKNIAKKSIEERRILATQLRTIAEDHYSLVALARAIKKVFA